VVFVLVVVVLQIEILREVLCRSSRAVVGVGLGGVVCVNLKTLLGERSFFQFLYFFFLLSDHITHAHYLMFRRSDTLKVHMRRWH
jgi:hypothetical protein